MALVREYEQSGTARSANSERCLTHSLDLGEEGLAMQATRKCSIDGCEKPFLARGWCSAHWTRWQRTGDPLGSKREVRLCSADGCERVHYGLGFCQMHWRRLKDHGDPGYEGVPLGTPRLAESNPAWKGNGASYSAIHWRVRNTRGSASQHQCSHCSDQAGHWGYDHSDPDEMVDDLGYPFSAKLEHYFPLCPTCHVRFDQSRGG